METSSQEPAGAPTAPTYSAGPQVGFAAPGTSGDSLPKPPLPTLILPKGGGAVRGIGEKFTTNPSKGTATMSVPLLVPPGRAGFTPQVRLAYDSGSGNGPFGLGWSLDLPKVSRKTDKGLPQYDDRSESDVFLLSGAEDLVPEFRRDVKGDLVRDAQGNCSVAEDHRTVGRVAYQVRRYRPRTEGLFARIERWTRQDDGTVHWRSISKDNVTSLYGLDADSRIADPAEPARVFAWLIALSFDDRGQAIRYVYKREDSAGIDFTAAHEANRTDRDRSAQLYPYRIVYGNTTSLLDTLGPVSGPLDQVTWLFELTFDYGEGYLPPPAARPAPEEMVAFVPNPTGTWAVRPDPFSSARATFEVRTYRRCRRVLAVHHFPAELGTPDYLVGSTDLVYEDSPYGSALVSASHSGYVLQPDGTYLRRGLPAVEFEYTRSALEDFVVDDFEVQELDAGTVANLPAGLADGYTSWADLDGEGLPGLLSEDAGHWYYRPNRGEGTFGPVQALATLPLGASLGSGQTLLDLSGGGQLDLVSLAESLPGFYERTEDAAWGPFRAFRSLPRLNWADPNLRFVDLNGDGHADVLVTADDVFTWYPSLAEDGFDAGVVLRLPQDATGPRLLFADERQSIFLADMTGDGLSDLVRVEQGQVHYWPNLGYGRFGAKVIMDDAPTFGADDLFDHRRVHFFDTDGSGPTDLVHEGPDGIDIYLNQCGNRWSAARRIAGLQSGPAGSRLDVTDLLGRGTACLVRSSPLPADRPQPVRFIDLMKGVKPRLLARTANNLGAETRLEYASSTRFYLDDLAAGAPWVTHLPFPVHVVIRVETRDLVSGNRFVSRYAYHHGFFDGEEREFRGFGRVEQFDTEDLPAVTGQNPADPATNLDAASYVPPVRTVTWFHTGVFVGRDRVSRHYEDEYFLEPASPADTGAGLPPGEDAKLLLPDTVLPPKLTADEEREACRALAGSVLRQEVYALDGDLSAIPYATSERNYTVVCLQPRQGNRYGVFFTHAREQLDFHYERHFLPGPNQDTRTYDPRITHAMTLLVDRFGNPLRSLNVGYPRRDVPGRQPEQNETHVTLTAERFANRDAEADWYRVGVPVEHRVYEWVLPPQPADEPGRRTLLAFKDLCKAAGALFPPDQPEPPAASRWPTEFFDWRTNAAHAPAEPRLRLMEATRTLYRRNDLTAALGLGDIESMALPFESYRLVFTPGTLGTYGSGRFTTALLAGEGRYVHSQGDANWWAPGGRTFFSPGSADTPAQERAYARKHFFRPLRFRDPFHTDAVPTESRVRYDGYDLLVLETEDALGNKTTAGDRDAGQNLTQPALDYRTLQPQLLTDPNRNRVAAAFDALGRLGATAVMGKAEENLGDSLDGLNPDLPETALLDYFDNPLANAAGVLGRSTSRFLYDAFAWLRTGSEPARTGAILRETHAADLPAGAVSKVQYRFSYSDGLGREIQAKTQAEPGPVPRRDPATGQIVVVNGLPQPAANPADPRWVGSGWVIYNNKGMPVRRFEPFFTDTERYENDVRVGVSPVIFYDPLGRAVATLRPDHSWQKVVFDPWKEAAWDGNDTVQWPDPNDPTAFVTDPRLDPDAGQYFLRLPTDDFLPTWYQARADGSLGAAEQQAAAQTAVHAATPTETHLDAAGRRFLVVAYNRYQMSAPGSVVQVEFPTTRTVFDAEGRSRQVIDARNLLTMQRDYDLLGREVRSVSLDAGERLKLTDAAGQTIFARNARGYEFRPSYDQLRRPLAVRLSQDGVAGDRLIEQRDYGESQTAPEAANTRGKVVAVRDQGGLHTMTAYDFKGNLLVSGRQFAAEYRETIDWSAAPALEPETFASATTYDALNRPTTTTTPDSSVLRLGYNEAGLLETVTGALAGDPTGTATPFVTNLDHDAKGQRTRIDYGNGTFTTYKYDPLTYRLTRLVTQRPAAQFPDDGRQPPPTGFPGRYVQNLTWTYDPVGNITTLRDEAQQTVFFRNKRVDPSSSFLYDAIYRLIEATGREQLGGPGNAPTPSDAFDAFHCGLNHPGDGNALGRYLERYLYDLVGNFKEVQHAATDPATGSWTRTYQTDPASNRLTSTNVSGVGTETYHYDADGNMYGFAHLSDVTYDDHDQMRSSTKGSGPSAETTYYVYDDAGQRVRKVTDDAGGTRKAERLYVGGYEVYRTYQNDGTTMDLERTTVPVMDDRTRIALVEHRTGGDDGTSERLIRYQHGNHLGTVSLELDGTGQVISYEEYSPYGSTVYQAVNAAVKAAAKRYRYTGKERDEESGFTYHGARYYAPWLGRWTSCDPAGMINGPDLYLFVSANPVRFYDSNGMEEFPVNPLVKLLGLQPSDYARYGLDQRGWPKYDANQQPTIGPDEGGKIPFRVIEAERKAQYEAGELIRHSFIGGARYTLGREVYGESVSEALHRGELASEIVGGLGAAAAGVGASRQHHEALSSSPHGPDTSSEMQHGSPVEPLGAPRAAPEIRTEFGELSADPIPKLSSDPHRLSLPAHSEAFKANTREAALERHRQGLIEPRSLVRESILGPRLTSRSRGYDRRSLRFQTLLARKAWDPNNWGPEDLQLGHGSIPHFRLKPGEAGNVWAQPTVLNNLASALERQGAAQLRHLSQQLGLPLHDPTANPIFFTRPPR
jgi:RHS repeat-associated protein